MLVTQITNHVQAALALQMQQYKSLLPQYLMLLNGTNPYIPTGTYTPFQTVTPTGTIPFGYGSLVGLGQTFHVTSALSIGQVTVSFQAAGAVSDGLVTAYLYADNGASPSQYAAPAGGAIAQAVEVYSAAQIAQQWQNQGSTGYITKTFTFDFAFSPGYYWVVFGTNLPGNAGNSLLFGLSNTAGLAFANGFRAGQNVSGFFAANGASGTSQLALTIAQKTSAPPLQPSNTINVSGIGALIAAFSDQAQLLENAIFSLDGGRQLFNGLSYPALGVQLDGIGEVVGQPRNGLSDMAYLLFILGKIGENFSNATLPEITTLVSLLFQTTTFMLMQLFPAEIDVQIPTTALLPSSLFTQAITILANSVGGGIGIGFGTSVPANAFAFSSVGGPTVGGGFGDLGNPSAGGPFASLFYNNPGV